MALRSTVYKCTMSVADIDRGYYADHALTLARHPSETEERLMIRVLAFAMFADERLAFGRGLSAEDEADLWLHDDTGRILHWIDVGLPETKIVRRAAGRADRVSLFAYGEAKARAWWQRESSSLSKLAHLQVHFIRDAEARALATLADRGLEISVTLQDGAMMFAAAGQVVEVTPERWL